MTKKLLFLLHLPPPVHGSSQVGLNIWESKTINETFDCRYINLLASKNVAASGKITFGKITGFILTGFKVLSSIIVKRPQLCYVALTTTGAAFYRDVLLVALLKFFRIKQVYHLHNKGISRYQNRRIHRFFYCFVFKNAEVILLSKHLYQDVALFVPEERIHICPNGIKEDARRKTPDIRFKTQDSKLRILFLSNLIESKGVYVLLEALAHLKQKEINFEGIFIGGEGDVTANDFNKKVAELKLTGQVNYMGKRFGDEKQEAFKEADIFAHPTFSDCFPLVLIEAMQHSLPIVSTFEGGIPDVVEDGVNGFLVPQKNIEALAEKIELLINNPELRQQMGEAGLQKYEKEFTLERFEKRMVKILNQIYYNNEKNKSNKTTNIFTK